MTGVTRLFWVCPVCHQAPPVRHQCARPSRRVPGQVLIGARVAVVRTCLLDSCPLFTRFVTRRGVEQLPAAARKRIRNSPGPLATLAQIIDTR